MATGVGMNSGSAKNVPSILIKKQWEKHINLNLTKTLTSCFPIPSWVVLSFLYQYPSFLTKQRKQKQDAAASHSSSNTLPSSKY